jgi:hypothetical protein
LRFQPEQVAFRMNGLAVFVGFGIFDFNGVGAVGAHRELGIGMVGHEIRPRGSSWDPGIVDDCPMINAGSYHARYITVCSLSTVRKADRGTAESRFPDMDHSISVRGYRATRKIFRIGEDSRTRSLLQNRVGRSRRAKGRKTATYKAACPVV